MVSLVHNIKCSLDVTKAASWVWARLELWRAAGSDWTMMCANNHSDFLLLFVFSSCVHICFGPNLYFSHWRILGHICRWMVTIAATWEPIIITHVTANTSDQKDTDCISLSPPTTLLSSLHHLSFHQAPPYGTRYNLPIWCCILKGSSRIKFIEFSWKVFHRNQKSNGEVKGLEKR